MARKTTNIRSNKLHKEFLALSPPLRPRISSPVGGLEMGPVWKPTLLSQLSMTASNVPSLSFSLPPPSSSVVVSQSHTMRLMRA